MGQYWLCFLEGSRELPFFFQYSLELGEKMGDYFILHLGQRLSIQIEAKVNTQGNKILQIKVVWSSGGSYP